MIMMYESRFGDDGSEAAFLMQKIKKPYNLPGSGEF